MSTSDSIKAAASGETAPGTLSEGATTVAMILAALDKLDPTDDTQWTEAGLPAMDAVNALLPASITRKRLEEVAPDFVRPTDAPAPRPEPFGGNGDHDGDGNVGGAAPAADDGGREGDGVLGYQNVDDTAFPYQDFSGEFATLDDPTSPEARIAALEADVAFLRKQFGWPTKDA